jgi:phage shock protein A
MNRLLQDARALLREKAGAALDEARVLRDLAADTARYAGERLRERYGDATVRRDPVEVALNYIVIDAMNRLIDAKKGTAVSIADEKRLAKTFEQETANVEEWGRRASLAEQAGDAALVAEARARGAEHAAIAAELTELWRAQKADVERLKGMLRALNGRIEHAKRDVNRIIARRRVTLARRQTMQQMGQIDEALRVLGRVAALDACLDEERGERDEGEGSLH